MRPPVAPLGVAAGVLATTVALRLHDPHVPGSWGLCPLRTLTGLDCPACGSLRAVNDLTHLRLDAAFHSNALLVAAVPLLVLAWAWWLLRRCRGRPATPPPGAARWWWAFAAVAVAFTVFRNTPWGGAYWA
ncbi:MAG TPA: DUF2752 domain-containing protein [Marmoricola sp.]|nr:DUF2752 domain-containing protein [Marmoricola sp.]